MNSNSKKAIASFAALQILLYHCWIPVFDYGTALGSIERFLIAATYSGVDVFFFISAYSLASRPVSNYRKFIADRAIKLLPLFLIALCLGRFLWFIPSIMVMYLVFPPLYQICRRKPLLSFILLVVCWAGLLYLMLGVIHLPFDLGIFLFRIPSIILGAYAVRYSDKLSSRRTVIAGILLLAAGTLLVYRFGYIRKLNVPFRGTFYLMGIPLMLGTVLLINLLAAGRSSRVLNFFGSMTLELYFTQMVLGTFLVNLSFRLTASRLLTNIIAVAIIISASAALKIVYDKINRVFLSRVGGGD